MEFNREVAEDAALYWNKNEGNLAKLIDKADKISKSEMEEFGEKAKKRIRDEYNWELICRKYERIVMK